MSLPLPPSSSPSPLSVWERERIRISEDLRIRQAVEIRRPSGEVAGILAWSWAVLWEVADSGERPVDSKAEAIAVLRRVAGIPSGEELSERELSPSEVDAFEIEQQIKYMGE
jgi:hypothetical protein